MFRVRHPRVRQGARDRVPQVWSAVPRHLRFSNALAGLGHAALGHVAVCAGDEPVSLGEGLTPMHDLPGLAREIGVARLWVKDEGLNPTASFKARGMSAAVTRARCAGVPGFVVPTAGNAGAALTAYGAAAGLPARVYAPETTPPAILRTIAALGAQLELV